VPMTFAVDRVLQRMVTHADGLVTYAELNEHLDAEERERGLGLPELIDASGASTNIKPDDVARLVHSRPEEPGVEIRSTERLSNRGAFAD